MRRKYDIRSRALVLTFVGIAVLGLVIARPWSTLESEHLTSITPATASSTTHIESTKAELDPEFVNAVLALESGDYRAAVAALIRFSARAPHVPEVYVNLGFAYLGDDQPVKAEAAFLQALELHKNQAKAYYGLGLIYENNGDLEAAQGAMRAFINLTNAKDPFLRKAQAALWEWGADPETFENQAPVQ